MPRRRAVIDQLIGLPLATENTDVKLGAEHGDSGILKDTPTPMTVTLESSTEDRFRYKSITKIINANSTGDITVVEGSGTTLWILDGTDKIDSEGSVVVGPGSVVDLWRKDFNTYYISGVGLTVGGDPGGGGVIPPDPTGSDPVIVENSTRYFVDPTNGNDSWSGTYGAQQGATTDGPWKTITKAEGSLPSSATALYLLEGESMENRYQLPSTHGGTASNPFILGAYYIDADSMVRRRLRVDTLANFPLFDQGVVEPERSRFPSYTGSGDDAAGTSRLWSQSRYVATITVGNNTNNIRIENMRVRRVEGIGISAYQNAYGNGNNPGNFADPLLNITVYNCHIERTASEGIRGQFINGWRVERCFISDTGRGDQTNGSDNTAALTAQGCSKVRILDNDCLFAQGEMIDVFRAADDFIVAGNWVYGAQAVCIYLDSAHSGMVVRNICMMAPSSETSHLDSTWVADTVFDQWGDSRGQSIEIEFEQQSYNSSWVSASDANHDLVIAFNIGLGNSDGFQIGVGSLTNNVDDTNRVYTYNNMFIGNTDQVQRDSMGGYSTYTNNFHRNNIHMDGGETSTDDVTGVTTGLTASNNLYENGAPGGAWNGTGDLVAGIATDIVLGKTTGFRNLTFAGSPTDQRKWGDMRVTGELIDLDDLIPGTGSNTISGGSSLANILLPQGITVATLADLRQDFQGNALSDPLDIGPFSSGTSGPGGGGEPGGTPDTIAFVGATQTAMASSTDWSGAVIHASSSAGDICFMVATEISGTATLNSLGDFTQIGTTLVPGSDSTNILAYKVLDAGDISAGQVDFATLWNAAAVGHITTVVYTNPGTTPINDDNEASGYVVNTSNVIGPSVTSTVEKAMIIQFVACDIDSGTYSAAPAGTPTGTERIDSSPGDNRQWIYVQDYLQTVAGSLSLEADIAQDDTYARWQVAMAPSTS